MMGVRRLLIGDRGSDGGKVGSATSVRNSNVWLGITEGGTYGASVVR
jgi:hypothetical protein